MLKINDEIPNVCCDKFNWQILDIVNINGASKTMLEYSFWGQCDNPNCHKICQCGNDDCIWNRISTAEYEHILSCVEFAKNAN